MPQSADSAEGVRLSGRVAIDDISIVTIVKNRQLHLDRQLAGIQRGTGTPCEVIIVDMSDTPVSLAEMDDLPVKMVRHSGPGLPLAAARNIGARHANGRHLLFLDVDCIPRRDLVARMHAALSAQDALICAEVRYLGPRDGDAITDAVLHEHSVSHPHRQFPNQDIRPEPNPGLFWSLLFGIRRSSFEMLKGFDEGFEGYGAEDTDFGFRSRASGLPLVFAGGTGAFHQYHGVLNPPLQHLEDIVRNANRFHRRWQVWPMEDWLNAFETLGLIKRSSDCIELIRLPRPEEIRNAAQPPSVVY